MCLENGYMHFFRAHVVSFLLILSKILSVHGKIDSIKSRERGGLETVSE